jgi:acyl-CoA thioester hydrolase
LSAAATTRITLRWRDMDMLGHLNQSVYHELLEEGRGALFASLGDVGWFPFVLVRVELDYRAEVRHDHEHVDVIVRVENVGTKSVTLAHDIVLPDGAVAASGSCVIVAWDPQARGSRALSDTEREALRT